MNRKIVTLTAALLFTAAVIVIAVSLAGRGSKSRFPANDREMERATDKSQTVILGKDMPEEQTNTPKSSTQQSAEGNEPNEGEGQKDSAGGKNGKQNDKGNEAGAFRENVKVKALYVTGPMAGIRESIDHFIELINTTELNALVIDIKENGVVNYESNVPEVRDNGLFRKYYDADSLLKKLHDNNIYVIGRIVCFRDNGLAVKRPDLAVKKPGGDLWRENGSIAWTNPYLQEVWKYNIDIAKEAVEKGFDEIQFDYVRFPTAKKSAINYGENVPSKTDAICSFLETAGKGLREGKGTFISADVFAIICESVNDGLAIGQDLERIGKYIDYICPMIYPSHYANAAPKGFLANGVGQGVNGVLFTAPDLKPYDVVYQTLLKTKDRISSVDGYRAKVRPYLQDFTASYLPKGYYQKYGPEQVRQQIKAVYDAGFEEWILWDGRNTYSEDAFEKE